MSYIICHVEKYKRGAITKLEQHNKRLKVPKTNKDIDHERTKFNITSARDGKFLDYIDKRLNEIPPPTRKRGPKNNFMAEILVSASPEFFANAPQDENFKETYAYNFFKDARNFIIEKYGKENVLGYTIHLDEATPHMHVNIVPILEDKLNPKALFSPSSLRSLQTEIWEKVGQKHGLKRGVPRDKEHRKKHLSVNEYKAREDARKAQERIDAEKAWIESQKEEIKAEKERIEEQWGDILDLDLTNEEKHKVLEYGQQLIAEREEIESNDFAPK